MMMIRIIIHTFIHTHHPRCCCCCKGGRNKQQQHPSFPKHAMYSSQACSQQRGKERAGGRRARWVLPAFSFAAWHGILSCRSADCPYQRDFGFITSLREMRQPQPAPLAAFVSPLSLRACRNSASHRLASVRAPRLRLQRNRRTTAQPHQTPEIRITWTFFCDLLFAVLLSSFMSLFSFHVQSRSVFALPCLGRVRQRPFALSPSFPISGIVLSSLLVPTFGESPVEGDTRPARRHRRY